MRCKYIYTGGSEDIEKKNETGLAIIFLFLFAQSLSPVRHLLEMCKKRRYDLFGSEDVCLARLPAIMTCMEIYNRN